MTYLFVLLAGMLMGLVIGQRLFSQYYRRARMEVEESKAAVRTIMYQTHHLGINPIAKRIRGLCLLGKRITEDLSPSPQAAEAHTLFETIEAQALSLEKDTLDKVKQFEHLQ